jgi:hypothetical protein
MEHCVRKNHEELEFSFWGVKSRATGRFPIIMQLIVLLVAMAIIAVVAWRFGVIGMTLPSIIRIRGGP